MAGHRLLTSRVRLCLAVIACWACSSFGQQVWINEIHYDNTGADTNEGVEIAGPAGHDLSGYRLLLYNGNGGQVYDTLVLGGVLPDEGGGYGTAWYAAVGLQNGDPDGIVLVAPDHTVLQFLSYEGSFTGSDGLAGGMTSVDVGVAEAGGTPIGQSLQLIGFGSNYNEFAWAGPRAHSRGARNDGQSFPPAYRRVSSVLDASGRFAGAGSVTNLSAAGQPGGIGVAAAGDLVHQAGFLTTFLLRPDLDADGDGLPDEADADNDNDGLGDEAEIRGTSFDPPVATAVNRADMDGDGASDGEEAAAGTDPADAGANLALVGIRAAGGVMRVYWRARSGTDYDVLRADGGSYRRPAQVLGTTNSVGGAWPWFVVTNEFEEAATGTNGGFYGIRLRP